MSHNSLWRLSVTTSAEAEEPVMELLSNISGQTACSYRDVRKDIVSVAVFFEAKSEWSGSKQAFLRSELNKLQDYGLRLRSGRISLTRLARRNWAEAWKLHFKSISIGSELLVKPSWDGHKGSRAQAVVILDPGLSFGTGHHPTTRFCLEQLVRWGKARAIKSFLDMGTGSGILAIAAAKLGYERIEAFDIDPECIRIARANARANHTLGRIRFWQKDVGRLPLEPNRKYSLVCANLLSDVLLGEPQRIVARVSNEGLLVLSGILETEFPRIQQAYSKAGMSLVRSQCAREWRSGSFAWRH